MGFSVPVMVQHLILQAGSIETFQRPQIWSCLPTAFYLKIEYLSELIRRKQPDGEIYGVDRLTFPSYQGLGGACLQVLHSEKFQFLVLLWLSADAGHGLADRYRHCFDNALQAGR